MAIIEWSPEEPAYCLRICKICGNEFKTKSSCWGIVFDDLGATVCLSCRITNPQGDLYKAKAEEDEKRAKLVKRETIFDGIDSITFYEGK